MLGVMLGVMICALIIPIRMWVGQDMGETALISFGWGIVNCFAAAAGGAIGGLIVFLISGRS